MNPIEHAPYMDNLYKSISAEVNYMSSCLYDWTYRYNLLGCSEECSEVHNRQNSPLPCWLDRSKQAAGQ